MAKTCSASGPDWSCDRDAVGHGLCSGHGAQQRRKKPLAALKGAHGQKGETPMEMVTVLIPAKHVAAVKARATARGVDSSILYREALAAFLELGADDDGAE